MPLPRTVITRANHNSIVTAVLAGETFTVAPTAPIGYSRRFQHQDWVDFVDPVQAGGNDGFNSRFHALESEFDLISTAITSVDNAVTGLQTSSPALGRTVTVGISNGASIPVPAGFQASETKFFAFIKSFSVDLNQRTGNQESLGFSVFANDSGVVTVSPVGGTAGQTVIATAVAIAKKGGW
jgi:hypothetical protein